MLSSWKNTSYSGNPLRFNHRILFLHIKLPSSDPELPWQTLILRQVYEYLGQLWDTLRSYLSTDMLNTQQIATKYKKSWQDIWVVILREAWFYTVWNVTMHFEKALHRTASPGSAKSSSMNWSAYTFALWQLEQRQIILPLAVVPLFLKKQNQEPHRTELDQDRHLQTGCVKVSQETRLWSGEQICCWE